MRKILQIRNIAVVSLLGFVMMFAAIAPTMNSAYAGTKASDFCQESFGVGWVGIGDFDEDLSLVKCVNLDDPCFTGVPVKSDGPTTCTIAVAYLNLTGENVILKDAIPAEWGAEVQLDAVGDPIASFNCIDSLEQANKGKKADKSATLLTCDASSIPFLEGLFIEITTRESPGSLKGNQETAKFKPTSCELFANSGAQLIAADGEGNPILVDDDKGGLIPLVLLETGPLQVPVTGEECEEPNGE